jgi:hypothetical protein
VKEYQKRVKFSYSSGRKDIEKFFSERFHFDSHLITELQEIVCYAIPSHWSVFNATRVGDFVVDCLINIYFDMHNVH